MLVQFELLGKPYVKGLNVAFRAFDSYLKREQ
jgi:hypothetical protein